MNYQCPTCGGMFTAPENVASVQCPHCGASMQVGIPTPPQGQPQAPQFQGQPQGPQGPQGPQAPQYQGQPNYGYQQPQPNYGYGPKQPGLFDEGPSGKSRGVAALLCFFLGGFGAHYFYVGKTSGGLITLLLTIITCGCWSIILLIQFILLLTMSQADFERKYVYSQSAFPLF